MILENIHTNGHMSLPIKKRTDIYKVLTEIITYITAYGLAEIPIIIPAELYKNKMVVIHYVFIGL